MPSSASAPRSKARRGYASVSLTRFNVSRHRFSNRGKKRGATILHFQLSDAARLVLVVRGPGPSCTIVARIPFRGRAGQNRVRFNGRIHGRPLALGTYLLTPRVRGTKTNLGRAFVTIASPGQPPTARILPDCTGPTEAGLANPFFASPYFASPFLASPFLAGVRHPGTGPASRSAADGRVQPQEVPEEGGVRGDESPPLLTLAPPHLFAESERLPALLGLAVLALLCVSLLGVGVEVVRHLRSPRV